MTDAADGITPAALQAIGELLNLAARHGIGVTFEPDDAGWRVGYIERMGGGDLSSDFDLEVAVRAARRPLLELVERHDRGRD